MSYPEVNMPEPGEHPSAKPEWLDKESFRIALEGEVTTARAVLEGDDTLVVGGLSLILVKPVSSVGEDYTGIRKAITQTVTPTIIGQLGPDILGIAIPDSTFTSSLLEAQQLIDASPTPIAVGLVVLLSVKSERDTMASLYNRANEALSLALRESGKSGKSRVVMILRPGQELGRYDLPAGVKTDTTLIHR